MVSCVFCKLNLPSRASREKYVEHLQDWHMMTEVEEVTRAVGLVFAPGEQGSSSSVVVEATSTVVQGYSTSSMVVEEVGDSPVSRGPRLTARVVQELATATGVEQGMEQEQENTSGAGVPRATEVGQQATARVREVEEEEASTEAREVEGEQASTEAREVEEEAARTQAREVEGEFMEFMEAKKCHVKLEPLDVREPLARYKAMVAKKGFKCHICDERVMSKGRLETHMRMRHGEPRLKCPKEGCPAEFCTSSGLAFHRARCGNLGKTYKLKAIQCPVEECGHKFAKQCYLMKHLKTHHKLVNDGKSAVSVRLADHMRKKHRKDKLECPQEGCQDMFYSKGGLTAHIYKKHGKTGRPPGAKCTLCEEVMYNKQGLANHMRKEHGGAKLKCPKDGCSAEYNSKTGLKKHTEKFHRGEELKEEVDENAEVAANDEQEEMVQEELVEEKAVAGEEEMEIFIEELV